MKTEIEFLQYGFRCIVTDGTNVENLAPEKWYVRYNTISSIKMYTDDKVFVELATGENIEFTITPQLPKTYDVSGAYSTITDLFENISSKSDGVS